MQEQKQNICVRIFSRSQKFFIDILPDKTKPVVTEKHELKHRDASICGGVFRIFGLCRFRCREENWHFFKGKDCHKLKTVNWERDGGNQVSSYWQKKNLNIECFLQKTCRLIVRSCLKIPTQAIGTMIAEWNTLVQVETCMWELYEGNTSCVCEKNFVLACRSFKTKCTFCIPWIWET